MNKLHILKRRIIRAYKNPKNWENSRFKGYPEGTYFGYATLKDCINDTIKQYKAFYGKRLKKWNYD